MGTFRTRVKKKGKRWIKGQSSTSNPTLKTYRNLATNNFFKDDLGGNQSALTVESLRRHDDLTRASNTLKSATSSIVDCTDTNTSYQGSVKTFNTFASDWSCCTNVTFSRLLNRFDLSSAHHKEMLAVLAAVTEVIKANGGQENNVEYFAALMSALDHLEYEKKKDDFADEEEGNDHCVDAVKLEDNSVSAILPLLSICIKSVPKEILQVKFSTISKTLMKHLEHYQQSEHNIILKSLLGCLAYLLRLQDRVIWNDSSTFKIYDTILHFVIHNKSKIRKAGQHAVLAILKGSEFCKDENSSPHPAASHTAKRINEMLAEYQISEGGFTIVTHTLNLLKEIISIFPKSELVKCCNTILGLMKLKNHILKSLGLQTLRGLFSSKPSVACFPPTLNAQLINALYDYQPSFTDVQLSMAWFAAVQEAFSNLARNDLALAMSNVPKFFKECTAALLSTKQEVIDNAAISLGAILKDCVEPAATEENVETHSDSIYKVYEILNHCLKYQYNAAWKQILYLLAKLYRACGRTCNSFMMDCLKSLAVLRETNDFVHANEVDHVFGCAIESMGPEVIVDEFPVQIIEYQSETYEVKRSWLLPLLKQYTKRSTLAAFFNNENLFRAAVAYRTKSEALGKEGKKVGERTYDLLQSQIWALLPSFCDEARDIGQSFPTFGKPMVMMLQKNDVNTLIMAAIRKLIHACSQNEDDKKVMAQYAKNCIVALFNVYADNGDTDKAARSAATETIKAYLTICDDVTYQGAYNMLLAKLNSDEAKESDAKKESFLDLIRLVVPYLPSKPLKFLFDSYVRKVETDNLKLKEEKQYYRLLEDMCACRSEGCNEFIGENFNEIKDLLLKTASKAPLPCRGPRIRTAKALLYYHSNKRTILEFLPECVMCCKEGNKRCRSNAFESVTYMGQLMATNYGEVGIGKYLDAICAGLVGNTSMMAASILALTSAVHSYQSRIIKDQFDAILENICLLAKCKTREIVGPALGFLKLVITAKNMEHVIGNLELIVKTLSAITDDCKRKYRQKIRDLYDRLIRKYGAATIIPLVPTHDAVTMRRMKTLKKAQDRKMRKRQEAKNAGASNATVDNVSIFSAKRKSQTIDDILAECDDEDDLSVDEESDSGAKKKAKSASDVFLTEDVDSIIDFTSAAANKNITMEKPSTKSNSLKTKSKKKTEMDFPLAPDGRLIITEKKAEKAVAKNDVVSDEESIASDAETQGSLSHMLKKIGISKKRKMSDDGEAEEDDRSSRKYQAGGSGIHRQIGRDSKMKTKNAKKKKKSDTHEPYEYIPLSRNTLNRRKKKKAGGQFKHVVKRGKKK